MNGQSTINDKIDTNSKINKKYDVNKVDNRDFSFSYFGQAHSDSYKNQVIDYLDKNASHIKKMGGSSLIIEMYDFNAENKKPTGQIFISEANARKNPKKLEDICKYLLSNEREFIPDAVNASKMEDYNLIKNILEENYGGRGRLKNEFLFFGRTIKLKPYQSR